MRIKTTERARRILECLCNAVEDCRDLDNLKQLFQQYLEEEALI